MPYEAVKSRGSCLKLLKSPDYNRSANSIRAFTNDEIQFIKENYLKYPNPVLAKMMGRGESTLISYARKLGIKGKVNTGCIQKGSVPPNKGKKQHEYMSAEAIAKTKATRFQKGQKPKNTKFDGATTVREAHGRPYIWYRLKNNKWDLLHRVVWRETMGEIPAGYNVQFKDGNGLNCQPSNLYIINREKQMLQNTIHRYDPELKSLIFLSAKLKRKIKSYEKQD